jgi:hypothetical protein
VVVLSDVVTGVPVVVELSSPRTTSEIVDASEHHLTIELDDKRVVGAPLHLVMTHEVAGKLAGIITEALRGQGAD